MSVSISGFCYTKRKGSLNFRDSLKISVIIRRAECIFIRVVRGVFGDSGKYLPKCFLKIKAFLFFEETRCCVIECNAVTWEAQSGANSLSQIVIFSGIKHIAFWLIYCQDVITKCVNCSSTQTTRANYTNHPEQQTHECESLNPTWENVKAIKAQRLVA